jgi:hypothetical protein
LETEIRPFSQTDPVDGKISDAVITFRDGLGEHIAAERVLMAQIAKVGLGP